MAYNPQYGDALLNALLDAIETTIGTAPKLVLRTGAQPANCAAAASGDIIATITLPSDWLANAATHVKLIANGPWTGTASGPGTAGHFRVLDSAGTVCHIQGTVGTTGCDLNLDNPIIVANQAISVNAFTITALNA